MAEINKCEMEKMRDELDALKQKYIDVSRRLVEARKKAKSRKRWKLIPVNL